MARDVVVNFRVGGVKDVTRAFATVIQAAENAEKARARRGGGDGAGGGGQARKRADETQRLAQRVARDQEVAERQKTRAFEREQARRDAIVRRSSEMAGRLAEKQATAEIRARERAERMAERSGFRNTMVSNFRHMAGRTAGGIASLGGMLISGTRGMVSNALQLGGGFSISTALKSGIEAQRSAALLSNSAYIPGKVDRPDTNRILERAKAVAIGTNTDKNELLESIRDYVAKSSDFAGGMENMEFFAKLAKGSGTKLGDVTKAAGILRAQNTNLSANDAQDMLRNIVAQGKMGAVEIEDLARVAGKVTKTAAAYGMDQGQAQKALLGLSQIAIKTSGSPDEAATVISNLASDTLKHQKGLRKAGLNLTDDKGQLIDPTEMVSQVFEKTGGNLGKITDLGYGARSIKFFEALAPIFQNAGGGKAGADAVRAEMQTYTTATYSPKDMEDDFQAVVKTNAERLEGAVNQLKEIFVEKLTPYLSRFADGLPAMMPKIEEGLSKLQPLVTMLGGAMGGMAKAFVDNPIAAALLMGAAKIPGPIGMIVSSFLAGKGMIDGMIAEMSREHTQKVATQLISTNARGALNEGIRRFNAGTEDNPYLSENALTTFQGQHKEFYDKVVAARAQAQAAATSIGKGDDPDTFKAAFDMILEKQGMGDSGSIEQRMSSNIATIAAARSALNIRENRENIASGALPTNQVGVGWYTYSQPNQGPAPSIAGVGEGGGDMSSQFGRAAKSADQTGTALDGLRDASRRAVDALNAIASAGQGAGGGGAPAPQGPTPVATSPQ